MYTETNFKSKKALREAVALNLNGEGPPVKVFNNGPHGVTPQDGIVYIEGPHFPKPHRWYAQCIMDSGRIVKVD